MLLFKATKDQNNEMGHSQRLMCESYPSVGLVDDGKETRLLKHYHLTSIASQWAAWDAIETGNIIANYNIITETTLGHNTRRYLQAGGN